MFIELPPLMTLIYTVLILKKFHFIEHFLTVKKDEFGKANISNESIA